MTTELALFIQDATVVDTHEHMAYEPQWVEQGPGDVLQDLFTNYVGADLISAGAVPADVQRLVDGIDPDVEGRWSAVADAWRSIRHTGYGQAVQMIASEVYGIDEIGPDALRAAQPKLEALRRPGGRLHLLRDVARLDHIQTDDKQITCPPDESGPDFFLYDISWVGFVWRGVDWAEIAADTGVTVKGLTTLEQAMEAIFEKHGPRAIAVKTQHAYNRTLRWEPRTDADAARAFDRVLAGGDVDEAARLCFGDWALARAAELARRYDLPVKIHTGYYAGNRTMQTDRIRAGDLCPLLIAYPDTRFVLMHIAWPYSEEVVALAKHFPNAWADLCWAWSINPAASVRFVRSFIHAAPASKLFAFGGDVRSPTSAYAYSMQMRRYLTKALEAEVEEGEMTEPEAIAFARQVLFENQMSCFDVAGTRAANVEATAGV
jgi:hypothetical protein